MKKYKSKIIIFLTILILLTGYFFVNSLIEKNKFLKLKSLISVETKQLLKKYVFPYRLIDQQQKIISQLENGDELLYAELYFSTLKTEIETTKIETKLSNQKNLKKFKLLQGFYAGIKNITPGSGYIDFYEENLIVLSSRGVLAYRNINEDIANFKTIKSNIDDFIGIKQFRKFDPRFRNRWFSLKDIYIFKNQIFISYTEEIKEDCWNTSVIFGNINYENIKFNKFFSSKECVHSTNNRDKSFNAQASGGRIINFDDDHILLSVGDYINRYLSQNKESINGKIIKLNINSGNYKVVSMGHRNPQGLYYDKENNIILETEHGPMGGDEINLIEVEKFKQLEIQNYGWPVASYGEHYGGKSQKNKIKYEKYPLYKSHIEHGFIEPLKAFVPSIGISEIVKIAQNKYVVSSLKDKSLYFFELNSKKKIVNLNRVEVIERVRDLNFYDNKLYLFMEDSASIGVINLG